MLRLGNFAAREQRNAIQKSIWAFIENALHCIVCVRVYYGIYGAYSRIDYARHRHIYE